MLVTTRQDARRGANHVLVGDPTEGAPRRVNPAADGNVLHVRNHFYRTFRPAQRAWPCIRVPTFHDMIVMFYLMRSN
jgi:hypothetical protein